MTVQLKSVFKDLLWNYRELLLSTGTKAVSIDRQIRFLDDFFIAEEVKDIVFVLNRKLYPSDDCKLYYPI